MKTRRRRVLARILAIAAGGFLGCLYCYASSWIVYHDSAESWLSNHGLRFVADLAEGLFSLGLALCVLLGLVFGVVLVVICQLLNLATINSQR